MITVFRVTQRTAEGIPQHRVCYSLKVSFLRQLLLRTQMDLLQLAYASI